jgi:tetratricopeptide (TPR) repeat protein
VPFLVPLAGLVPVELRSSARRRVALTVLVATALLCLSPLELPGDPRATSQANLASELLRRGDLVGAEAAAARATALDPLSPEAAYNHGLTLRHLGREREAIAPFERAAALEPSYEADCLAEIGAIRAALGDVDGAREALTRALQRRPGHPEAQRYLRALEAR